MSDEDLIRRLRAARKLPETERELEDYRSRESLKSYIKAKSKRMKWLIRRG